MAEDTYSPTDIAKLLGVNSHTIRRWSTDHAAHLSASAKPDKNVARKLTAHDLEVLREVQRLRSEGLQTPVINERLASMVFITTSATTTALQTLQEGQEATQTALQVVEVLNAIESRVEARLAAQEERLETRIKTQESRQRDSLLMFSYGFLTCAGLFGLLLLLAILFGR